MIPRRLGYESAILVIVCSAAIFFLLLSSNRRAIFAVRRPVTALLSFRGRLKRWLEMAFAALQVLGWMLSGNFAVSGGGKRIPGATGRTYTSFRRSGRPNTLQMQ
jgi:hypothetical protein